MNTFSQRHHELGKGANRYADKAERHPQPGPSGPKANANTVRATSSHRTPKNHQAKQKDHIGDLANGFEYFSTTQVTKGTGHNHQIDYEEAARAHSSEDNAAGTVNGPKRRLKGQSKPTGDRPGIGASSKLTKPAARDKPAEKVPKGPSILTECIKKGADSYSPEGESKNQTMSVALAQAPNAAGDSQTSGDLSKNDRPVHRNKSAASKKKKPKGSQVADPSSSGAQDQPPEARAALDSLPLSPEDQILFDSIENHVPAAPADPIHPTSREPERREERLDQDAQLTRAFQRIDDGKLIQEAEPQRVVEKVLETHKWGYVIMCAEDVNLVSDDADLDKLPAIRLREFSDRKQANEFLDKNTSATSMSEGVEAIAKRSSSLSADLLLKVDIELSNGRRDIMWVKRDKVKVLTDLPLGQKRQKQWHPAPRPKFRQYIVECEKYLKEYDIQPYEEGESSAAAFRRAYYANAAITTNEIEITKLGMRSFTDRAEANAYAAKLFLKEAAVPEHLKPSQMDVFWWRENALPFNEHAEQKMFPDGLYEVEMEAKDMRSRVGYDKIAVFVREIDDVTGPVNF
ncbi:hypothetical protein F5Y18DRAFT_376464 [Xylariaceae sp. FL1019]|nr:hypothetical protein F5Y18DRAFT_376464 [Xylariaceae sp. FL1019]